MPPKKSPITSPVKSPVKAQTQEDSDICQTYIKMDQREHVLNLPDTYIGSIEKSETELWIYDKNENKIVKKTTSIVPGFYKIFDEILVNAYDQYVRTGTVKEIRVEITPEYISVMNDGDGIDVEIHPEHDVYIPELLFGNLLTSANYHQTNKITGGKNGLGSKVTNIFSRRFIVETVDGKRKRIFRQEFSNNMLEKTEPIVEKYTKKSFTKITFYPDYPRFHMDGLDDDIEGLLMKRVYDMAAITDKSVSVYLNEQKIELKDFESYVDLYIGAKSETKRVHEEMGERWEVIVCDSNDDKMEQVSFVNGIYTWKGGKHVEALATTISTKLAKYVEGKGKKKIQLKPSVIRDNMWIFAKATIEDPSFDSQTKEYLTTPPAKFGSKFTVSDKFIEKIAKLDIVEKAIRLSEFKDSKILTKTDGKKTNHIRGIPKLDDANWAGTPQSSQCTLILTEGDSAKAFAIAGLSVIGRDKYGVFPLRGKLLNVRDAPDEKVSKNEEIKNLKIILGLQQSKEYETTGDLRYGSIMILTDADVDGSHIKGLLINLFHNFWPSLLKQDGFIKSMMTPIVKARKRDDIRVFYTLTEYEAWKASPDSTGYEIKYYKGLGTSTSSEAKEYFKDLDNSEIRYLWNEDNAVDISVNLAFNKDKANDRKEWLLNYDRTSIIEQTQKDIPIEEFINKDLIHFSKYDCERSVPCIVDGYKPSQRKVLYGALLRNLKKSIKVAQFAAYVAEKSAYHHGEQSLNECIIGMAQDYVGSNNMNYLEPEGNFGSRLAGGEDHASPRYIFTKMTEFSSIRQPIVGLYG
jgi:DNA topoisomerase-2